MKTKLVNETLNELVKAEIVPEEIELSAEDELEMQDRFESAIKNELNSPEFARRSVSFRVKGGHEIIDGVPMARLKDGSFLMKIGNKFKKFNIDDIIEESFKINKTKKLNEGTYDEFLVNYGSEIKEAIFLLRKIHKEIESGEITESDTMASLDKIENIYDTAVVNWIDGAIGGSFIEPRDIANVAIDNMNATGTEMQMVIYAIHDFASNLGIYPRVDEDKSFYPTSSFFRDIKKEEKKKEKVEGDSDDEEDEEDEENINLADLLITRKPPRISTT
jgi:hypothetical protein